MDTNGISSSLCLPLGHTSNILPHPNHDLFDCLFVFLLSLFLSKKSLFFITFLNFLMNRAISSLFMLSLLSLSSLVVTLNDELAFFSLFLWLALRATPLLFSNCS
uniref:Uncharacterized protein n=1 Tax=Setaria italica TaxID=4555 RepID=K3Z2P5_SETIT